MDRQERSSSIRETTPATHFQSGRRRAGCSFSYLALLLGLLLGLLIGTLGTFFYVSSARDTSVPPSKSVPGEAAITVQLSPTYLSQVIAKEASQTNILPGSLKNIQVTTAHSAPLTISGDDQISVMGFMVTNHVTVQFQPVIRACQLQVSVTHADLSSIPVTSFVSSLEDRINQQLANNSKSSLLPQGFAYCVTNVRTENSGLFVAYSATPA